MSETTETSVVWPHEAREAVDEKLAAFTVKVYEDDVRDWATEGFLTDHAREWVVKRTLAALAPHVEAMLDRARAEAWDEGRDAGHQEARAVNPEWPAPPVNPYRVGGAS